MADVFISYARANADRARAAASLLADAGVSVWIDEAIPTHRAFADTIEEQLGNAKAVLVLWSEEAVKSHWVQSEANRAREDGKLVQVLLDGARLPMPFDRLQCESLAGWAGESTATGWRKALASLTELASHAPDSASAEEASPSGPPVAEHPAAAPLLAVLPFDNLSRDPDMDYFSDGISEDILHTVAKTTTIKVLGRSSTFQLRGSGKAPGNVASLLGASHVLDGSVHRAGDRLRVFAEIVNCASQTQVWSERFDRDLTDIFAVQDEIAEAVARALNGAFAPSPKTGPISGRAYDLYLRARRPMVRHESEQYFDLKLIEQALDLAPDFAEAWALLAFSRATALRFPTTTAWASGRTYSRNDWDLMRSAANTAIRLDERSSLAYLALNLGQPLCGAHAERGHLMAKALAAAPNDPIVLLHAASDASLLGYVETALDYQVRSARIDPYYADPFRAAYLQWTGRRDEANRVYDSALRAWPDAMLLVAGALRSAYEIEDWVRYDDIRGSLGAGALKSPIIKFVDHFANRFRHWSDQTSEEVLAQLRSEADTQDAPSLYWAGACCAKGRADDVFNLLDEAGLDRLYLPEGRTADFDGQYIVMFAPPCQEMRRDRRFVDLCGRLGLCHEWASTEHWPDFAEDPELTYDLKSEARRLARNERPRAGALRRLGTD